jgi:ribosome-associated protein YbcJ (S4-like RNA binding protein)
MIVEELKGKKATPIWKLLKETGVCKTSAEAKNEIKQGAIKINGEVMTDRHFVLSLNGRIECIIKLNSEQEVKECDTSKSEQ